MSFSLSDARADLSASLLDSRTIFGEDDSEPQTAALNSFLQAAAADLARVLPREVTGSLTLVSGQRLYAADPLALRFVSTSLVDDNCEIEPYDRRRVRVVPTPRLVTDSGLGGKAWLMSPTPSDTMLWLLGPDYPLVYVQAYVLSDMPDATTVLDEHRPLLVLRAQVEALRGLALRNAHKAVSLRDAIYSQTRNSTPAALAEEAMRLFEHLARAPSALYGARASAAA